MIKKFIGEDIHGYINVDIDFRDKVTFLIGINGSGKTTIIRLIRALLCARIRDLLDVDFKYIEVVTVESPKSQGCRIACQKTEKEIVISCNEGSLVLEGRFPFPDYYINLNKRRADTNVVAEIIDRVVEEIKNMPSVQHIMAIIKRPFVMGMDRRVEELNWGILSADYRNVRSYQSRGDSGRHLYLDSALAQIEAVVHRQARIKVKRVSDISSEFKKKVMRVIFETKPSSIKDFDIDNILNQLEDLDGYKSKVLEAAKMLNLEETTDNINYTFSKLAENLATLSSKNEMDADKMAAALDFIVLNNQLKAFDKIVELSEAYNKEVANLDKKNKRFLASLNQFLKESGKEVIIDNLGDIFIVIHPKGKNKIYRKIYEASSGEKQLIIMLGNLAFLDSSRFLNTFIIDEPELSLHIAWQEIFIDTLMSTNPDTQFIVATHSPNIVAKLERREWCVDLSRGK